jgi:RHS repeat-associated protein
MNRVTQHLSLDELLAGDDLDRSKFDLATGLQNNRHRHYDPTPGRWLDESRVGYERDDVNVTPYVGLDSSRDIA